MKENLELIFDQLKEEDLEEVAKLYDAERTKTTNLEKMKQTFQKVKENPEYQMIVVKNKEDIIGFAQVMIHQDLFEENNPFVTIWSVRVKKEYRRQKVGTRLFLYIERIAKERNCEFICLLAEKENKEANLFYTKLGYTCENGYLKQIGK